MQLQSVDYNLGICLSYLLPEDVVEYLIRLTSMGMMQPRCLKSWALKNSGCSHLGFHRCCSWSLESHQLVSLHSADSRCHSTAPFPPTEWGLWPALYTMTFSLSSLSGLERSYENMALWRSALTTLQCSSPTAALRPSQGHMLKL